MYHSNLLWQITAMTEDRQREAERRLARVVARWSRRLRAATAPRVARADRAERAERVGVEPTRA